MKILMDKRSQKYFELESNNKFKICCLFHKSKCKFRFSGSTIIYFGKDSHYNLKKLEYL